MLPKCTRGKFVGGAGTVLVLVEGAGIAGAVPGAGTVLVLVDATGIAGTVPGEGAGAVAGTVDTAGEGRGFTFLGTLGT
jgi:hypothetical protein